MQPARLVLTDLDGVIRHWPKDYRDTELRLGIPEGSILRALFAPDILQQAITGAISDAAWRASAAEALATRHGRTDAVEILAELSSESGRVDRAVCATFQACRAKATVVLVTNATSRLASDLDKLALHGLFDHVVNSSAFGFAKPDRRIFEIALRIGGASPDEAVFIDDTMANITAASAMGIRSHWFENLNGMRMFLDRAGLLASSN